MAEKLLFNIDRILVKQSRQPPLPATNGKSCRRAEKAVTAAARQATGRSRKLLKYIDII
jgi:hypothetical protein